MIYITRKEHFNAAHKLYNPDWSEEKNKDVFGVCSNENWHGHNYILYVCVFATFCIFFVLNISIFFIDQCE